MINNNLNEIEIKCYNTNYVNNSLKISHCAGWW